MSWSFQAVGKAEAVVRAIDESPNNKITGESLKEWNEAKPALRTIVCANVGNVAVSVEASGHASFSGGAKTSGQCNCVIRSIYGFVE